LNLIEFQFKLGELGASTPEWMDFVLRHIGCFRVHVMNEIYKDQKNCSIPGWSFFFGVILRDLQPAHI
jgi:hypothetical protein